MFLAFDTENPAMEANLVGGLRRVVLHEAHHCLRHAGPGYGNTLGEALVSEGLASRFVMEILGGEPEPWNIALDEAELRRVAAIAEPELDDEGYDHDRWFIGRRNARKLPRWAGYSLGWRLIGTYLERVPDTKPSRLARVPAAVIISQAWDGVSGRAEMVSG